MNGRRTPGHPDPCGDGSAARRRSAEGLSAWRENLPAAFRAPLTLLVLLAMLTGCATIPGSSDVTVLRRIGDAAEPTAPPGPMRGAGPLETVRGWVLASGATAERHEAARAFLTPQAAGVWDDGAAPTVVADQVDTVFSDRSVAPGQAAVRVRATRLGTVTPEGAFVSQPGQIDIVVGLTEQNGQWRISSLPPGTLVRRSDLRANTRPIRTWFLDADRARPVSDSRYLSTSPARSIVPRTLQLLLAGPSEGLAGAAVSALPPGTALRSAVATTPDGASVVDLTRIGGLDDPRRLQIAQQVVLTLAGVGVPRVRLLVDGRPLVPDRPELTIGDVLATVPGGVAERRDLPADPGQDPAPETEAPALAVADGRVRTLGGDPVVGPAGSGAYGALAAGVGPDGQYLAVVADATGTGSAAGGAPGAPAPPRVRLLTGRFGGELGPTSIEAVTATRPSWSPGAREVWTVLDGTRVVRAQRDETSGLVVPAPVDASALVAAGTITALRLSPDGARVAAVAGGRVVVGAVARDAVGGVRIAAVRTLRPDAVDGVLDVDWTRTDRLAAVGTRVDRPVAFLSADGLDLDGGPTTNLTLPLVAVAASPGRPLLVVDQNGMWTLPSDGSDGAEVWRSVPGVAPTAVPAYPG